MTDGMAEKLQTVLGKQPLDVQIGAAGHLAEGRPLLARLPTGTGKTLLAGAPFAAGLMAPRQMVFMTPLRTLTSAQADALREQVDAAASLEVSGLPWEVKEQSGAVPDDPQFLARAVVCTFDQALSSALHIPYSLSPRKRNINAGAVLTSYLVADELHLYPRDEAFATLLWLLQNRPRIQYCLMTATMTEAAVDGLADLLSAEPLTVLPESDRRRLDLMHRQRTVCWQPTPLDAEEIARAARDANRTLVVVNTVDRAIALGRELRQQLPDHDVYVLHSRFYRHDRDRITQAMHDAFGRQPAGERGAVLVATQVVEVGLDISAERMFVELAPANALVQRWGRCARWGGQGNVTVAPPEGRGYPYAAERQGEQMLGLAREWLVGQAGDPSGIRMDDAVEQDFLEHGHGAADRDWLDGLRRWLKETALAIGATVKTGEYASAGRLIRHVQQRTLLVHGDPCSLRYPYSVEGFGVQAGSLFGLARRAGVGGSTDVGTADEDLVSFDLASTPTWAFMTPVWPSSGETSNAHRDEVTQWRVSGQARDLEGAPTVAINPTLVQYHPDEGLQLAPGHSAVAPEFWAPPLERAPTERFTPVSYRRETLEEHIRRALHVASERPELGRRLAPLAGLVDAWLGWPEGLLQEVIVAAIVMHDTGKLAPPWQEAIRGIQSRRGQPYEPWLAHSDSAGEQDPNGPPQRMPPHARSGAAHALELARWFDRRVAAGGSSPGSDAPSPGAVLFNAIAAHHSPSARDLVLTTKDLLDAPARQEAGRVLRKHDLPEKIPKLEAGEPLDTWLVRLDELTRDVQARELFALSVVVRILRLADGWSQQWVHDPVVGRGNA